MSTSDRLREAREQAGFATIADAVRRYGWTYSTYAGHENGSRGIKSPDLQKYAEAFGVGAAWLLTGRPERPARRPSSGTATPASEFSEAVTPFRAVNDTQRLSVERLAGALAPGIRNHSLYQLRRSYPTLMLQAGDILVLDPLEITPQPGQIVIANAVDEETGVGTTCLRIAVRDALLPPYGEDPTPPAHVESALGTIVASMRPAWRSAH